MELWLCPTQLTGLFYLITDGGKPGLAAEAKNRLATVRKFAHMGLMGGGSNRRGAAIAVGRLRRRVPVPGRASGEVRRHHHAQRKGFRAIAHLPVFDCAEFFDYLEQEKGLVYEKMIL